MTHKLHRDLSIVFIITLLAGLLGLQAPHPVEADAAGVTELISISTSGEQGNQNSHTPSISADGRFVAFVSTSNNLVERDTNGADDVFVHDRQTNVTERVSVSSAGLQANGASYDRWILYAGRQQTRLCIWPATN